MKTLHIGLLLPSSSIVPMGKLFEKGLKKGLSEKEIDCSIEVTKEFIGQGAPKQVEDAITKLISYDDVDLVIGILSNKLAESVAPKLQSSQVPILVNNLGENIPAIELLNPYVFTHSLGFWQHAWALGFWGVQTFGKKGMYISSVYDAGYSFSQMFYEGMVAADPSCEWNFSVTPMPAAGQLSDISAVFPFLEQNQPDFVFATFCGKETTLFINEFIARGLHKKTKLLGLPFLLEPFAPLTDDMTIYTSSPTVADTAVKAADIFYHLGLQTADMVCQAALGEGNEVHANLKKLDKLEEVAGCYFLKQTGQVQDKVSIMENRIAAAADSFESICIASVDTFSLSQLVGFDTGNLIGWNNPYLCV